MLQQFAMTLHWFTECYGLLKLDVVKTIDALHTWPGGDEDAAPDQ